MTKNRKLRLVWDIGFVVAVGGIYTLMLTFLFGLGLAYVGFPPTNWNFVVSAPFALIITGMFIYAYFDELVASLPRFPDEQ